MEAIENLNFIHEIKERAKMPWKPFNIPFWGYLIGIIIGIGGLGIWCNLSNCDMAIIAGSISTYSIALLASSFIDLNLIPHTKNKVSMLIYSVIFLGLGITFFIYSTIVKISHPLIPATLGFIFSILIWYIAYADSDKFNDESYNDRIEKEAAKKHGKRWPSDNGN